jgi:type VI protein secretion system component VasF
MTTYDDEQIAELLRALPPAPAAWVEAAKQLPMLLAGLDTLIVRAEADAAFRTKVLADLEAALAEAGVEPQPVAVAHLRSILER